MRIHVCVLFYDFGVCVCYVVVAVVVGSFCPESVVRLSATADREQY